MKREHLKQRLVGPVPSEGNCFFASSQIAIKTLMKQCHCFGHHKIYFDCFTCLERSSSQIQFILIQEFILAVYPIDSGMILIELVVRKNIRDHTDQHRSEERRVGKECR